MILSSRTCTIIGIACLIGVFVVFGWFFFTMVTGDIFSFESSVFDILLFIFMFIGTAMVLLTAGAIFLVKGLTSKHMYQAPRTKKCVGCGAEMGATEMSCPSCFRLQPMDEHQTRRK